MTGEEGERLPLCELRKKEACSEIKGQPRLFINLSAQSYMRKNELRENRNTAEKFSYMEDASFQERRIDGNIFL